MPRTTQKLYIVLFFYSDTHIYTQNAAFVSNPTKDSLQHWLLCCSDLRSIQNSWVWPLVMGDFPACLQRAAQSGLSCAPSSFILSKQVRLENREITASVTRLTLRNQNKVRSVTLERFWHGSLFGACAAISNNRCTWKHVSDDFSAFGP